MMAQTIGEQRIQKLAVAIARSGGVVTFPTAMAMLRENKQATSRALEWLVESGMLRKIGIPGGSHVWLSERALVRTFAPNETPAVYKLSRFSDKWTPGATFNHDQLALRVLFSLAEPEDMLTEHEIRSSGTWRGRIPDGVLRYSDEFFGQVVLELEIETSKKTGAINRTNGTRGGWAKLAERVFRVSHNWVGGPQATSLGLSSGTLIVAPPNYLESILKKISEIERSMLGGDDRSESTKVLGSLYTIKLEPDGSLGPVVAYM